MKDDSDYSIWSTSVTESFDTKSNLSTGYFSYFARGFELVSYYEGVRRRMCRLYSGETDGLKD